MRRVLLLGAAASIALGGAAAFAQQATTQTPAQKTTADTEGTELQEVVVTGSLIRRTDTETPSPVQVITQEDLVNSGYTTVSEVLRNLSANGAGTLSQSFNSAFAGGGAGVSLRGLTVGGTLTLIDGHRMVGYPLTDDGERNFVDVSAIPFNAVESIEVLKDGASAEYGSDAIAGVVNIILRKTFTGANVMVEGGTSSHQDGDMVHVNGIWGVGDLASDGYNAYVSAEYRGQAQILDANRHGAFTNLDWSGVGGVNTTPGAGNNPFSPYPASLTGYLINPGTTGPAQSFFPGCTAALQAANKCTFQTPGLQLQPATSSENVLGKFTKSLGENWQSITTLSVFETHAQQAQPSLNSTGYPSGFTIISYPPGGSPTAHISPVLTLPSTYPGNPYGAAAPLVYNFPELGLPMTDFKTDTYRFMQELDGKAGGWDISGSLGVMYARMRQDYTGFLDPTAAQQTLNNGYILGSGGSAASAMAPFAQAVDSSGLTIANLHGSRELLPLPGGNLSLALGAEYYDERLNSPASPASVAGIQGMNDAWAIGSMADMAGFAELNASLFNHELYKQLELNAAARYDQYNTFAGGELTPKFGIKYTMLPELAFRGTWGKGFRAPSIPETNSGLAFGANAIPDPVLCKGGNPATPGNYPSQCAVAITGVLGGNPALQPERTTNLTLGTIFEPIKQFSIAADYYDIKINQDIISAFEAGGLGYGGLSTLVRGPQVSLPQTGSSVNTLTPVGLMLYNAYPYLNASQDETDGFDIDMKGHFDLANFGRLSGELTYTHVMSFKLEALGTSYQLAGTHGPSGVSGDTGNPKDRATFNVTWDRGPVAVSATVNYIGSFSVTDPSVGQNTCAQAMDGAFTLEYGPRFLPGGSFPGSYCTVGSFTDVDFYAHYDLTKNFQVHASILNAFNQAPPLDMATYGGGGGAAYDAAMHQAGAVGAFYIVGASFTF